LIPPSVGRASQQGRALSSDRLEREREEFFATIAAAYEELALSEPERIRTIDAAQPADRVLGDALAALEDLLVPR
jgi:dTMP kinase